jgi:hypothetical protein
MLRYTSSALHFSSEVGQQNPQHPTAYVSSSDNWTNNISPAMGWLSTSRSFSSNTGLISANINVASLNVDQYSTTVIIESGPAISNNHVEIPITLSVMDNDFIPLILSNLSTANFFQPPGFKEWGFDPGQLPPNWAKDLFLPTATLSWDNSQSHSGTKSVRIDSPLANDVRWLQSIPVSQNATYRLPGWIKTEDVVHSDDPVIAGANLGLFGT